MRITCSEIIDWIRSESETESEKQRSSPANTEMVSSSRSSFFLCWDVDSVECTAPVANGTIGWGLCAIWRA